MSNHKLMCPTTTYETFPAVVEANRGVQHTQKIYEVRTKQISVTLKNPDFESHHEVWHDASDFGPERNTAVLASRKMPDTNTRYGNRQAGVSGEFAVCGPMRKNMPPDSSTQPGVLSQSSGNWVRGHGTGGTAKQVTEMVRGDYVDESDSDSDRSLDFSEIKQRKQIDCIRLPYKFSEDIEILKFVLKSNNIDRTGSLSMWKELEAQQFQGQMKRSHQSLKNRFLRNIKPHLLTKYRTFLTRETLAKIKKRFPELRKSHRAKNQNVNEYVWPSGIPTRTIKGNSTLDSNRLLAVDQVQRNVQETKLASVDKAISASEITEQRLTPIRKLGVGAVERKETAEASSSENAKSAVELFKPGKKSSQTFQCTKIIRTLGDKTNLNLNFVLVNDQSKLTGPVKVDIIVSVSSIQESEAETERADKLRLDIIPNEPEEAKKKIMKPRPDSKVKPRSKYILKLRKSKRRKLPNVRIGNPETLAGLIQQMEEYLGGKSGGNKGKGDDPHRMILRSRSRMIEAEPSSQASTQETNCSVEDDEDYSQVYREVSRMYQMVIESEEQDEDKDEENARKKQKTQTDNNPGRDNILLKNMVGMLSSSSKVFSGKKYVNDGISKRL